MCRAGDDNEKSLQFTGSLVMYMLVQSWPLWCILQLVGACFVLCQGRVWPSTIFVRAHSVARNRNSLTDAQEQESGGVSFEGGEPHGSIYCWGQGHCLTSWVWKIAPELLESSFPLDLHGLLSLLLSADLYHYYLNQYLCIILSHHYSLYWLTSARLWFLLS